MTTYTNNSDSVWYYCNKDGQLQEPVTAAQLEELVRQGTVSPKANVLLKTNVSVDPNLLDLLQKPHYFGLPKDSGQYHTTLLHIAVINENIDFAKFLIQNGAEVHARDSACDTPLRKAVHENKIAELIKFLITTEIAVEEGYNGEPFYNDGGEWSRLGNRLLNREQLKEIQTLHEWFARKFASRLSVMLRTTVDVKLTSVDQMAYSEFIFGLDNPTCFNLLKIEPLDVNIILDISPSIIYPMIDRMLGGSDVGWVATLYRQQPRKPLNEGESCLARKLTDEFLEELKHAWHKVVKLNFSVVRVESNPTILQIMPPNEAVVILCFDVAMMGVRGCMTLCFQYNFFEGVQKASLDATPIDTLLEKAEQKLQDVSLLLSKIHQMNKDQTSSIRVAIKIAKQRAGDVTQRNPRIITNHFHESNKIMQRREFLRNTIAGAAALIPGSDVSANGDWVTSLPTVEPLMPIRHCNPSLQWEQMVIRMEHLCRCFNVGAIRPSLIQYKTRKDIIALLEEDSRS
ncbi:MAG: ankyrin repeat domain-containing protein [Planctomycetaceae bacterium]|jgi:flagellar motor switch protein FliM|nr:ankyrin repeat domain-containing protein [Planctomycetaceae bacterium]